MKEGIMNRRTLLKAVGATMVSLIMPRQSGQQEIAKLKRQRDGWEETAKGYAINSAYWRKEAEFLRKMFRSCYITDARLARVSLEGPRNESVADPSVS